MADVVRLSIVYDTSQAAAGVATLNARGQQFGKTLSLVNGAADIGGRRLRTVALAGTHLAAQLSTGNVSALSLASSLGRLAGPTAAAGLILTIVNLVNAFQEFNKIVKDISLSIDKMQTSARDAHNDVRRLLGEAPPETKAEQAIKRLRDAAAAMRQEAQRLGGAAGKLLEGQADILLREIPGMGRRARRGEQIAGRRDFNESLRESNTLLQMLKRTPLEQMTATMGLYQKRLEFLIKTHQEAGEEAKQLALLLHIGAEKMRQMERAAALLKGGLETIQGAIEEFVITGTFAFQQFLDNILRLLYRDFTDELIHGILKTAAGTVGAGSVTTGGTTPVPGPINQSLVGGGVTSNVHFTINAIDAQGVAQFINQNGAQIAATVAGHADRSRAIRRRFFRG
ncbi:MAG TPA: hypothetical protein VF910_00930 [Candidatus Bathyarchaeia archaeon]